MKIPVFYRPEQNCWQEASPSAAKPQFVVESWLKKFNRGTEPQLEVKYYQPALMRDLARVHDGQYLVDIFNGFRENGYGTKSPAVAETLTYTVGSFMAASRYALRFSVACSPTSGFHHAGYASAEGYCTFNGLMVAAYKLVMEECVRVGILDCDAHYGNGTDDIRRRCGLKREVQNYTRRGEAPPANVYFDDLRRILNVWKNGGIGIAFFQAGADPHISDPYGGAYTSEELRERDHVVFSTCKKLELPVVWNLAGGYQQDKSAPESDFAARIRPVLDIHDATMDECIKTYGGES